MPLVMYMNNNDIDVLCINETKIHDMELLLPDTHSIIRNDRTSKGGGIAILYLRELLTSTVPLVLQNKTTLDKTEIMCVKVQLRKYKSLIVCSIYRPKFYLTLADIELIESVIHEL